MPKTVLLADVDLGFVRKCRNVLECCGYRVTHVSGLDALFDELRQTPTQLVIAGHLASGINGEDIYKVLCHLPKFRRLNILIHATPTSEADTHYRANSFICDPFDVSTFVRQVVDAIGRSGVRKSGALEPISTGPLYVDPRTHAAMIHETEILLSRLEFRLLYYLAKQFGRTVPRRELMLKVWGPRHTDESLLNAYVMKLRKKMELRWSDPLHITTVPGVGYRLQSGG